MEFGLQGHMQEWVGEDWDEDRNYYNLKKKKREGIHNPILITVPSAKESGQPHSGPHGCGSIPSMYMP